jgi:hypothetical protein
MDSAAPSSTGPYSRSTHDLIQQCNAKAEQHQILASPEVVVNHRLNFRRLEYGFIEASQMQAHR